LTFNGAQGNTSQKKIELLNFLHFSPHSQFGSEALCPSSLFLYPYLFPSHVGEGLSDYTASILRKE
jgi:hypothetical protein